MTRVKRGVTTRKRHKREIKRAKGYRGTRSKLVKKSRESNLHAGKYAYRDRRTRKRMMRRLWIIRINAAVRAEGLTYREFIHALDTAQVKINRKMLADMAVNNPEAFRAVIGGLKQAAA